MYCTVDEVMAMMKDGLVDTIIGNDLIEDPAERMEMVKPYCNQAIEDASAEIDGYIGKRYPVPLTIVPPVIRKIAKDIAVYNMASRTGIDEKERENTIYVRYKNAISFLLNVAKGLVNIDAAEDGASATRKAGAQDGFRLSSNPRIFSREYMKGW